MPASVFRVPFPVSVGTYGGCNWREIKKCKNVTLLLLLVSTNFTYILSLVLCPVPCLHFYRPFCQETEKRLWHQKSVPLGQKRF
ncbi:unnamed protein product [Staurois parvus]|uniref:Uncharacterized protein n=1 Tax=Staurois parvus TaxID=386267 RepID=A0ABN9A5Y6_9NEOB|nr:unnamed protein product [Staurois parvus]